MPAARTLTLGSGNNYNLISKHWSCFCFCEVGALNLANKSPLGNLLATMICYIVATLEFKLCSLSANHIFITA